jgi:hypothetical protein
MGIAATVLLALALPATGPVHASTQAALYCPSDMNPLMTAQAFAAAKAGYEQAPAELDPPPPGLPPVALPKPDLSYGAQPGLPLAGAAMAYVLLREDGHVDDVLVPCASSKKVVKPLARALRKARFNVPTRGGVPVKHVVVVPFAWDNR